MLGGVWMRAAVAAVVVTAGLAAPAMALGWGTVNTTPNPSAWGDIFFDVTAISSTDAWAVGDQETQTNNATLAAHYNGTSWTAVATPNPIPNCQDGYIGWAGQHLSAADATSTSDVWAVGEGCYRDTTLVEHWNGSSWKLVASPSPSTGQDQLNDVDALSPTNAWAVGFTEGSNGASQTLVLHWNGTSWSRVASPSPSPTANILYSVSAVSSTDIWAVGSQNGTTNTLIEHYNGTSWSVVSHPARPNGSYLLSVAARASNDVWAVGTQGGNSLIEHYNGSAWSIVPSPNAATGYGNVNTLRSVIATSATYATAVGMFQNSTTNHQHRTFAVHWNGTSWSTLPSVNSGQSSELTSIAKAPAGRTFTGGIQSPNPIDIYFQTYQPPNTLVLTAGG